MKTHFIKYILLIIICVFTTGGFSQEVTYTAGSSFYYNSFDTGTPGSAITYNSDNHKTVIVTNSPSALKGAYSLASVPNLNNTNQLYTTYLSAGTDLATTTNNTNDTYTWSFIYRNNSTINPVEPFAPGQSGAPYKKNGPGSGQAAWKYWLVANSTDFTQTSTQGYYITHIGNNLILRYRGNDYYQPETSFAISNNTSYVVRITRKSGVFTLYVNEYLSPATEALTSRGSLNTGGPSTFNSYFDCTDRRPDGNNFQWDDLKFYKNNKVTVSGFNVPGPAPGNGITSPTTLTEGQQGVVIFGFSLNGRGFTQVNRIYITNATGTSNFNGAGKLYKSNSSTFTLTGPNAAVLVPAPASVSISGTNIQLNSLSESFATSDVNAANTPTAYYFVVGNVVSSATITDKARFTFPWTDGSQGSVYSGADGVLDNTSVATGQTFTFYRQYFWAGSSDKYWNTYGNWKNAAGGTINVPPNDGTADVVIPASVTNLATSQFGYYDNNTQVTINLRSLTVATGATLSIVKNHNLQIGSGGLTVNGTLNFTYALQGVYPYNSNFDGNNTITIAPGATATVNNITLNKLSKANTVTLSSGNAMLNVTGTVTPNMGTLETNGALTLKSSANATANVATINTSNAQITGNVYVERFISGGSNAYRGYRLLSSPVYAATVGLNKVYGLSYLQGRAYLTGTTGVSGGFTAAGNPTIYLYRENIAPNNTAFITGNFRGVNKINDGINIGVDNESANPYNIPVGNGFMFFFRGDISNPTPTNTNSVADSTTITSVGTLNQGTIVVRDWFTPNSSNLSYTTTTANSSVRGFNLVGNPYASSIDWNTFSSTNPAASIYGPNISSTIYIYNATSKNYSTYNGVVGTGNCTNIIPSGQGFFVLANIKDPTKSPSLTFTEAAKVNTQLPQANLLLSTAPVATPQAIQFLRLQVSKDSINKEDMVVLFNESAKAGYVLNEDSPYLKGSGVVSLSSNSSDNIALAINQIALSKQTQTIPLTVNATSTGIYRLSLTEIKNMPKLYDVWLIDTYKKDSLDVRSNPNYNFNINTADATSFGSKRFSLVIRQNPAYALKLLDFDATKVATGAQLAWITENENNYTNFTVEKSTDNGKTFEVVGGMKSNAAGKYSLIDKFPKIGLNQYRLKQDDFNGTITYSKIVNLMYSNASNNLVVNNLNVYPNPASSTVNVAIAAQDGNKASYIIKITNGIGTVIKSAVSSQPVWQDNVSNLLPGTYFVQVINNNDKAVVGNSKFIKN